MRLFHGGKPGLNPGDALVPEPHYMSGCPVCAAHARGENHLLEPVNRNPEHVYMTTDRPYARFYASKYPKGDLYAVEPVGDVERSDEDPFESFFAPSARVVSVLERFIELTPHQRRGLIRRWQRRDYEVWKERLRP